MNESDAPKPTASLAPTGEPLDGSPKLLPCWNEKGVYGNQQCPELARFVHCRNCPVFSAAGVQLLNRNLPAAYREEWTRHIAVEKHARQQSNSSAILFRLQADWMALPTHCFQEIAERRAIHSLPHRNQSLVLGLANVRGELLICVSLGHLLRLDGLSSHIEIRTNYHRLVVVNWEGNRLAVPVDEVHGPHRFSPQELKTPSAKFSRPQPGFTQSVLHWQRHPVGLLDAKQLFSAINRNLA